MTTKEERIRVASSIPEPRLNYQVRLLVDDNAPDAESYYGVHRRYETIGTLQQVIAHASREVKEDRLCGADIYVYDYQERCWSRVTGFFGYEE